METLKKQLDKVILFLLIFNVQFVCGQLKDFQRNGIISSYSTFKDTLLEVSYSRDTVYGLYKLRLKNGQVIEEGFRNNFKVKTFAYYSNKPNSKGYYTGLKTTKYIKLANPRDTFEMLRYDIQNSLVDGLVKDYDTNGKLKSICKYSIKSNNENLSNSSQDSCVHFYANGSIKETLISTSSYEIENKFYENGLIKNKVYRIFDNGKLIYGTHDNYYSNGKLKNTSSLNFINGKKDGVEQEYAENGSLVSVSYYKAGLLTKVLGLDKKGKLIEMPLNKD